MKLLLTVTTLVCLGLLAGCGNGLSSDFEKSGRYAFILVKKAHQHETILERDVNIAYAQAEADAKSDADKKTLELLKFYLSAFQTNDETPLAEGYVKGCESSLTKIFEQHEDPGPAGKDCTDALQAKTDAILKEMDEKTASPKK